MSDDLTAALRELRAAYLETRRLRHALCLRIIAHPNEPATMSNAELLATLLDMGAEPRPAQISAEDAELLLTQREIEVLHYTALGYSSKEIAKAMFITMNTVKTHMDRLHKKLKVPNRAAMVMAGVRLGIVRPEDPPEEDHP